MKPILERIKKNIYKCNDPVKSDEMILFLVSDDYFGVVNSNQGLEHIFHTLQY